VFQYTLIDTTGKQSPADLRSYQDWHLRYYLNSVPGVAEVAPLGGFVRQYQVNVDPSRLQAYNIPISKVVDAVRSGNNDVGGRLIEFTGAEYMVRGLGYAQSTDDIAKIVLAKTRVVFPFWLISSGAVYRHLKIAGRVAFLTLFSELPTAARDSCNTSLLSLCSSIAPFQIPSY